MTVGEVIDVSERVPSLTSSHDFLQQAVKREDISDNESTNHDGQTPCTLCKLVQEPCSTQTRSESLVVSPSERTCNRAFFQLWSACLLTTGGMRVDYEEWAKTCRDHSLDMSEEDPSRRASRVTLSSGGVPPVASNPTSILAARALDTAAIVPIVVPIAVVLGLVALAILAYIYWIKRRRNGESFRAFWFHRISFHRIPKIRTGTRDGDFEIDRQSENTNDFVMISPEPGFVDVHSWSSFGGHFRPRQHEHYLPFHDVWSNSQIVQQFRRIPDIVPHPWGSNAVHIKPKQPGRRFRVDPSGSTEESGSSAMISQQSTIEGAIPATIIEDEEDFESMYHPSYNGEDEESSLISYGERRENEVFLISNRPAFTLSSNSHSSNSHHFKIIPPTPTESSRSHGRLSQVIPPPLLRRPIDIPPAPRRPAPVPPRPFPHRPSPLYNQAEPSGYQSHYASTLFSEEDLSQAQVDPHPPEPPRSVSPSQGSSQYTPSNQTIPTLAQPNIQPRPVSPSRPIISPPPAPVAPPISVSPSRPIIPPPPAPVAPPTQLAPRKSYNVQRRPSAEGNDPLNHTTVPPRPKGARQPSHTRRPSIDEDVGRFGPAVPSGDSIHLMSPPRPAPRPLTPQHSESPYARQRSHSASGEDAAAVPVLSTPRRPHPRTLSSESLALAPDDSRMLYPGPVRAGGYSVKLPSDATESRESLHSRPTLVFVPREGGFFFLFDTAKRILSFFELLVRFFLD